MSIGNRIRGLLEIRGMPNKLENKTGIDRDTWRNVRYAKQKVNEDHIAAVCEASSVGRNRKYSPRFRPNFS